MSPGIRALVDRERIVPPLPTPVRARAMARARSAPGGGNAAPALLTSATPGVSWAAVVALACAASATVGAAAYALYAHRTSVPSGPLGAPPPVVVASAAASEPRAAAPDERPSPPPAIKARRPARSDSVPSELRLLRESRAAVARGDFAAALPPIAEHARRFSNGHLAEEREALRVQALVGLGRAEEARRAAASFGARFPRSVLRGVVSQTPLSPPR